MMCPTFYCSMLKSLFLLAAAFALLPFGVFSITTVAATPISLSERFESYQENTNYPASRL